MLDIKYIREHTDEVRNAAKNKNAKVDIDKLLELDNQRRDELQRLESVQSERNSLARESKGGKPTEDLVQKGKDLKVKADCLDKSYNQVNADYLKLLYAVPNIASQDTPVGKDESENVEISKWGERPKFEFKAKDHVTLGEAHGTIDLKRAAKVSGARFAYLMNGLVKLQFAIINWTIDVLTSEDQIKKITDQSKLCVSTRPFQLMLPPVMLRTDSYAATARLKAEEVTYKLADDDLWLIGSAEHSMVAMYQDEILDNKDLPLRFLGYSTSFRREAGSYGKDLHGILRMHHFDKLEMESFTGSKDGMNEHKFMVAVQEYLMQELEIPYHVLLKCTGDMGDPNFRGVDIEAWIPSQNKYRETHSADYMTDYQARRLNLRLKDGEGNISFAHTNDATAFAMGRTMIAIMENYQQADGSVAIPRVLQKYYGADKL
ncbi:serine--tRNA ligase [Candidatus Saccharibacteria bacterium]|nr:serine--tRNA ligase [Candidatus Saccharibacteria bacterium]